MVVAGLGVGVGPNPTEAVLEALLATAGVSAALAALEAGVSSQMEATRVGAGGVELRRIEVMAAAADAGSTAGPAVESAAIASTLTSEQLQALPLAGRDWKNFALDEPANAGAAEESSDGTAGQEHASGGATGGGVTVDGAGMKLAFGGRGVGQMSAGRIGAASLMGPGANEAAVATVMERGAAGGQGEAAGERAQVEARGGGSKLHGQIFLFDQQNLWGAQNPFTQWVKETAPGTGTTVPAFEPFAYTPPDRRMTLGAGVGGPVKHTRLTWFAALDADLRNDPGVSTVKHPDDFFAQPTNDEMQVLSARLGLPGANPVAEWGAAYSRGRESLAGLLGPAARTSRQEMAFARVDGRVGERHSFTLEGTGAMLDAPGGGLTRVSESYGNHSFGATRASETWVLGRWEAFLTENLLMVTQGSMGRQVMDLPAEAPSASSLPWASSI